MGDEIRVTELASGGRPLLGNARDLQTSGRPRWTLKARAALAGLSLSAWRLPRSSALLS
jgi:hypothetical protein